MVTITLDDRDRAVLEELWQEDADIDSLAESTACQPDYLRDRLPELADNGLVEQVDEGVYSVTDNGKRALVGSPAGTMDDRIDTPEAVEEKIQSFDLRPDREEALRNAFSFLHYWGTASDGEIIDGVYSENPAGFESMDDWWTDCIRDHLEALPLVEAPGPTELEWRYTETPTVADSTDDGRVAPDDGVTAQGSVKYALETAQLSEDEQSAVRGAFGLLVREGEVSAAEVKEQVYADHDAGYESADEWWTDAIQTAFEFLPGVEPADETRDGWQYRQSTDGPMSSGPGAEVPDEPLGPEDDNEG